MTAVLAPVRRRPVAERVARFAPLFPDPGRRRPVTVTGAGLVLVAIAVGTVISLLRTGGTGPLQSIWQEDAKNVLQDAYNMPFGVALFQPINGYLTVVPRLLGEITTWFPVRYAAAVMSVSAAVITAALTVQVYVASGAHLRSRLARVAVSAPMLFTAVSENYLSEIYNRPVCLHFFAAYAVFWLLLWTPSSRLGRVGAMTTVWLAAASSIIFVAFIPLAAVRLYYRRTRYSLFLLIPLIACAVVNFSLGLGSRPGALGVGPLWAFGAFFGWAVPQALLGWRWTQTAQPGYGSAFESVPVGLTLLAWAIVAAVIAVAVAGSRRGWLRPQWMLAALAGVYALLLFGFLVTAAGSAEQRYLCPVELLIFAALVSLLVPARRQSSPVPTGEPAPGTGNDVPLARTPDDDVVVASHAETPAARTGIGVMLVPLVVFAVFLLGIGAVNFRFGDTFRSHAPQWTVQVKAAHALCRRGTIVGHVNLRGGPKPYASVVSVPCSYILGGESTSCWGPECEWVDPPVATRPTPTLTPTPTAKPTPAASR